MTKYFTAFTKKNKLNNLRKRAVSLITLKGTLPRSNGPRDDHRPSDINLVGDSSSFLLCISPGAATEAPVKPAPFGLFQCPSGPAEPDTTPFSMLNVIVTAPPTQFLCYYHQHLLSDGTEDPKTCGSACSPLL